MNINILIDELSRRDIRLSVDGEKLNVDAPKGTLSPELLDTLRQRKVELIATLKAANDPSPEPSPTTPPPEIPSDLAGLIQAMGKHWRYSIEDFETAYEGARTDPTAWRVLCLEDQRRFGWTVPTPEDIEQAVQEAAEERRAILEHDAKLAAEQADRITQLARAFYGHCFGPAVQTRCCVPRCNRYCAEGVRLRDAYYGEVS